jgi:hypothetical protein
VRSRAYPAPEHTVYMAEPELDKFMKMMQWSPKTKPGRPAGAAPAKPKAK